MPYSAEKKKKDNEVSAKSSCLSLLLQTSVKRPSPLLVGGSAQQAHKQRWCSCVALGKSPSLSGSQPERCSWRCFQSSQVSTSNDLCTQALGGFQQTLAVCVENTMRTPQSQDPRRSPTSLFCFPHLPCHTASHACFLSFAPGVLIPVQLRKPLTPRQNSGPVTCWGPLNFQSPWEPTAASLFLLIYVLLSPEKLQE